MASEAIDVRNRLLFQSKDRLMDNAAVIIAALAVLIAAGALLFGGVAMYVAFDATRDAERLQNSLRLTDVYLQEVHVLVESEGLDLPPLPERN